MVPSSPQSPATGDVIFTFNQDISGGQLVIAAIAPNFDPNEQLNPLFTNSSSQTLTYNETTGNFDGEEGNFVNVIEHVEGNSYRIQQIQGAQFQVLPVAHIVDDVTTYFDIEGVDRVDVVKVSNKVIVDPHKGGIIAVSESSAFSNELVAKAYIYKNNVPSVTDTLTSSNNAVVVTVNNEDACYDIYVTRAANTDLLATLKVGNTKYFYVDMQVGE